MLMRVSHLMQALGYYESELFILDENLREVYPELIIKPHKDTRKYPCKILLQTANDTAQVMIVSSNPALRKAVVQCSSWW